MTPPTYTYKASYNSTMKNYTYGMSGRTGSASTGSSGLLSFDIEYAVLKVIQKQIESCKEIEEMR